MRTQEQVLECIEKALTNPTDRNIEHAIEDIDYFITEFIELLNDKLRLLVALSVELAEKKGE